MHAFNHYEQINNKNKHRLDQRNQLISWNASILFIYFRSPQTGGNRETNRPITDILYVTNKKSPAHAGHPQL